MRKDGVRRKKKQDHRGRRRGLREGEKGEREKGEGGGGGGHGVQIRLSFSSRKTERERENRVVQRSAFGFLWQQQAIILNCHLLWRDLTSAREEKDERKRTDREVRPPVYLWEQRTICEVILTEVNVDKWLPLLKSHDDIRIQHWYLSLYYPASLRWTFQNIIRNLFLCQTTI